MDVTVVGSIVIDLTSYVERFPSNGETVLSYKFQKEFGGKGANQCVMSKLLGAHSTIIGKVGDDIFGRDYVERFKKLSINTDYISVNKSTPTGMASISVRKQDGANQIVLAPGANFEVTIEDIDNASQVICKSKVVLCQLEIPLESTCHALKIAKENNVFTILNPAPIPDIGLDLNQLPPIDVLCPNEKEASLLTNIDIKNIEDAFEAIRFFFNNYSEKIRWPLITMGSQGVVFGDSKTKDIYHEPAPLVNAIDSTGAGDCFTGSLAFYFANCPYLSVLEKVKRSIHLASLSVQKPGTQSSFPSSDIQF